MKKGASFIALCLLLSSLNILSSEDFFLINHIDEKHPISLQKIQDITKSHPNLYQRYENSNSLSPKEKTKNRAQSLVESGATKVSVETEYGKTIEGYFFDRGKKTVLVTGPGLWKNAESLAYFANWFKDYDLFILDPRWSDTNTLMFKMFKKPTKAAILERMLELINIQVADVTAVLTWLNSHKNYEQKYAKGICYSSWMFIATQQKYQHSNPELTFDKMILNSCGLSIEGFMNNIITNTKEAVELDTDAIHPWFVKKILDTETVIVKLMQFAKMFTPNFSITDYLSKIKNIPILFIHGQNDKLITYEDLFQTLWNETQTATKAAFITPFEHAANDRNAEIYKEIVDTFITTNSTDEFITKVIS